jgi:hypothetical protein
MLFAHCFYLRFEAMPSHKLVFCHFMLSLTAILANLAVSAATFLFYGWNVAAAHAAARNTARFSGLWFLAAFVAPGMRRILASLPDNSRLVRSFVAAHMVHFAVVALMLVVWESARIKKHPGQAAATVLLGFLLVVAVGLTSVPRASRAQTVVHRVLLYGIFLIFFSGFLKDVIRPLHLVAILFAVGLLLRLTNRPTYSTARQVAG